jgi:hypothetical protein
MSGQTAGWDRLRLRLRSIAPPLYPPAPRPACSLRAQATPPVLRPAIPLRALATPPVLRPAIPLPAQATPPVLRPAIPLPALATAPDCEVCRGAVRPGFARCYQCGHHDLLGHGLLADAVVPISYAIRGTAFADDLWRYKWARAPAASAQASVLALLLAFLADHGACVWRRAGMPPPGRLAVVPTGSGRPDPHPLLRLISPCLRLPICPLAIRPGRQGRDLDLDRFRAGPIPAAASVLLLDDTWVSGASAQSAAAALKQVGARHVAVVVLGRHVNPDDPAARSLLAGLTPARYDPSTCAVHLHPHDDMHPAPHPNDTKATTIDSFR